MANAEARCPANLQRTDSQSRYVASPQKLSHSRDMCVELVSCVLSIQRLYRANCSFAMYEFACLIV
eukprot:scaffold660234_cov94-Prasinocladus_malaysianus.AAC.1